jgi:hypothetical protein
VGICAVVTRVAEVLFANGGVKWGLFRVGVVQRFGPSPSALNFGSVSTPYVMKAREDLHRLIDTIDNEKMLRSYLALFRQLRANETGALWNSLSAVEQQELMSAYDESFDSAELVSHTQMREEHRKWLSQ